MKHAVLMTWSKLNGFRTENSTASLVGIRLMTQPNWQQLSFRLNVAAMSGDGVASIIRIWSIFALLSSRIRVSIQLTIQTQ